MNPARVKRAVNGLAERVVYIQWDEQPLPRRHDSDDYVQMQHTAMTPVTTTYASDATFSA